MMALPTNRIGKTSLQVTELGFGGASIGNLYVEVSDQDAFVTLNEVGLSGVRYFDTAPYYGFGLSERRLGDYLRTRSIDANVISTKVGRVLSPDRCADTNLLRDGFTSPMPFRAQFDYTYDGILRSYEDSQQRLGLAKIDILYVHDIGPVTHGGSHEKTFRDLCDGGYKALEELRDSGEVRAIGLGVNEWQICEEALNHGDYNCFLLAGRYTLLEQGALASFLPKCIERDISVIIGGAYNSGILAAGVRGSKTVYYNYEPAPPSIIERVSAIESICDQFQVTLAAAALQFPLAHPAVASVIPGLATPRFVEGTISNYRERIPNAFWLALQEAELISPTAPCPTEGEGSGETIAN